VRLLRLLFWDLPRALFGDFFRGIREDLRAVSREVSGDVRSVTHGDPDA
jgi:hypothetical protein